MMVYLAIGKPTGAVDGVEKVTGNIEFTADITLPGSLWVKVLRSPFPHAIIRSIDISSAVRLPGVAAIVTGQDFPEARVGVRMRDMPVLAIDKVRFTGEPVVAVAAENPDVAELVPGNGFPAQRTAADGGGRKHYASAFGGVDQSPHDEERQEESHEH